MRPTQKNYELKELTPRSLALAPTRSIDGVGWQKNPSSTFATSVYSKPESNKHAYILEKHILVRGFGIERTRDAATGSRDWQISWENEEEREKEHMLFAQAFELVVQASVPATALTSAEYSEQILPQIWEILSQSKLYRMIFERASDKKGTSAKEHVQLVPQRVDTDGLSVLDTISMRMAAIQHDIMKAFDTAGDQLYHSLGGAKLIEDFFVRKQADLTIIIAQHMPILVEQSPATNTITPARLSYIQTQVVQIARLHHLFEMADKKLITNEQLHEICKKSQVSLSLLTRFISADGQSVVEASPTPEIAQKYAGFLIENMRYALLLLHDLGEAPEIQLTCVAVQELLRKIMDKVDGLYEAFQKILKQYGIILLDNLSGDVSIATISPRTALVATS